MNKIVRSVVMFVAATVSFALSLPLLEAAAPPHGRVAIMNAHSGLCLSPAGGGRDKNGEIV